MPREARSRGYCRPCPTAWFPICDGHSTWNGVDSMQSLWKWQKGLKGEKKENTKKKKKQDIAKSPITCLRYMWRQVRTGTAKVQTIAMVHLTGVALIVIRAGGHNSCSDSRTTLTSWSTCKYRWVFFFYLFFIYLLFFSLLHARLSNLLQKQKPTYIWILRSSRLCVPEHHEAVNYVLNHTYPHITTRRIGIPYRATLSLLHFPRIIDPHPPLPTGVKGQKEGFPSHIALGRSRAPKGVYTSGNNSIVRPNPDVDTFLHMANHIPRID